ncbi:MAG TPA: histidine kinase [Candidatus Saccharimonadales bacterium]|nr:histidine kinase [Candidatus Saccharimonadales bacterium]
MHPLLAGRLRPALYFGAWLGIGLLIGALLSLVQPRPAGFLALLVAPLTLFYAFACLSAWWVCRANPLGAVPPERLAAVIATAAALAGLLWAALGAAWDAALGQLFHQGLVRGEILRTGGLLAVSGAVLYAQSMAGHYFLLAAEAARNAERRLLESQVAAREAELRALRAQLNPHFLFNSLNSISALAGSEPEAARRMCQLLGEFLRASLSLGARQRVAFAEELALAECYLAVEQVRFGARLGFEKDVPADAGRCLVPPLLIQPLIENAVKHGVADRVEGGTVRVAARVAEGALEICVENPRDPEAPARRGQGMGLENVRRRLAALDPRATRVDAFREPESFRVLLRLPAATGGEGEAHGS